jgi:hypothetical protein
VIIVGQAFTAQNREELIWLILSLIVFICTVITKTPAIVTGDEQIIRVKRLMTSITK